ncbi:hypothetical protein BU23DRAFT_557295 [Bimuria novae-zelandiae CBS 107.79]|uniref:Endonuclease/exonuclease/phosphatase domain-containing protein n=1 Tax=Bimuria novae-zelandiae CBS 107.79 TaxID=1447943 RepID=A0A6A5UXK2_9PLEO|nr:hypothetical protein BU23DRAFT_557295 [Bimuria novae-zelandiae CBS 107.79]
MAPQPRARMSAALTHLVSLLRTIPPSSAVLIFLQEMSEDAPAASSGASTRAADLSQIADTSWIRETFNVTDLTPEKWSAHYGQTTLIDRRLSIEKVERLRLVSEFGRDALMVDLRLTSSTRDGEHNELLRVCNVQPDSMAGDARPIQWEGIAAHLQDDTADVSASILAGDRNATRPRDGSLPQQNGFKDSYFRARW